MKKLMFAAALMAAGAAMAGVESDVVGYQTKSMNVGEKNYTAATFMAPSGVSKLGDIKANNTAWGNSYIMFLDKKGATAKYTHSELGTVDKSFYYVNDAEAVEYGCDVGWYLMKDEETLYPMNDLEVPYGQGFQFFCQDKGASLTYAGAVAKGTTELTMNVGEKNYTGFIVPKDGFIGDIVAENTAWGNSYIMFLLAGEQKWKGWGEQKWNR